MAVNSWTGDQSRIPVEHRDEVVNGVRLHVVTAGPEDGPLVILLHGFPEFWYGWRHQLRPLVEAGYRVWMPDQRGYNRSEKPAGIDAYALDELAADAISLVEVAGRDRATLVGHDAGGWVAWWAATNSPERVERLVVINMPHPAVLAASFRSDPRQFVKGIYVLAFQPPVLPERLVRLRNWGLAVRALRATSRPSAFTERELRRYRAAWSRPNAFRSMLCWYRAALRHPPEIPKSVRVEPPTLLVWGTEDAFLREAMAQPSVDLCTDGRLERIEGATHWVHHEEPERIGDLLVAFLTAD